jgi:hypothetical protein
MTTFSSYSPKITGFNLESTQLAEKAVLDNILLGQSTALKQDETKSVLDNILLELKDDINATETIWYDKITPTLFYVRRSSTNQDTGVITVSFYDVAGVIATPIVANLIQATSGIDYEFNTIERKAVIAGLGYSINDRIQELQIINMTNGTLVDTIWINKTTNLPIAAPIFSDLIIDDTYANAANQIAQITATNTLLKPADTLNKVSTVDTITNVVHIDDNASSITVDAVTLPLPTGASTDTLQTIGNTSLDNIDNKLTATNLDLDALVINTTGIATEIKQNAQLSELEIIKQSLDGVIPLNTNITNQLSDYALNSVQTDGTQKTKITDSGNDVSVMNGSTPSSYATNSLVTQIHPASPFGKSLIVESGLMGTGSVTATSNLLNASSTSFTSDLTNPTYGGALDYQMAKSISSYVKFNSNVTAGSIIVIGSNDNSNYKVIPFWAGTATQNMSYVFTYSITAGTDFYFDFNTPYRYVKLYVNSNIIGATDVSCFSVVNPTEINRKTTNISDGINTVAIKAAITQANSNDGSLVTQENPNTQTGANFTVTGNTAHTTAGVIGIGANLIAATLNSASQTNLNTYGTLVNTSANSKQWNSFVTQINCNASLTGGTVIFEGSNDGITTNYKPILVSVNGATPSLVPVPLTTNSVIMVSGNIDYKFINFRLATISGAGASVGAVHNFNTQKITFASASGSGAAGDIIAASTSVLATNTAQSVQLNPNGNTVKIGETVFIQSVGNSSTAQLASSAIFIGTIQNLLTGKSLIVSLRVDQPVTINILQYIDAAGTQLVSTSTFTRLANIPFNESIQMNGNYAKITVQNTGVSATTNLVLDTWFGDMPPFPTSVTNAGNFKVSIEEQSKSASVTQFGTITTGGTAQTVMVQNLNRRAFEFYNTSDTAMTLAIGNTPTAIQGIPIPAGGWYVAANGISYTGAINIFCATTGKTFTFIES